MFNLLSKYLRVTQESYRMFWPQLNGTKKKNQISRSVYPSDCWEFNNILEVISNLKYINYQTIIEVHWLWDQTPGDNSIRGTFIRDRLLSESILRIGVYREDTTLVFRDWKQQPGRSSPQTESTATCPWQRRGFISETIGGPPSDWRYPRDDMHEWMPTGMRWHYGHIRS